MKNKNIAMSQAYAYFAKRRYVMRLYINAREHSDGMFSNTVIMITIYHVVVNTLKVRV